MLRMLRHRLQNGNKRTLITVIAYVGKSLRHLNCGLDAEMWIPLSGLLHTLVELLVHDVHRNKHKTDREPPRETKANAVCCFSPTIMSNIFSKERIEVVEKRHNHIGESHRSSAQSAGKASVTVAPWRWAPWRWAPWRWAPWRWARVFGGHACGSQHRCRHTGADTPVPTHRRRCTGAGVAACHEQGRWLACEPHRCSPKVGGKCGHQWSASDGYSGVLHKWGREWDEKHANKQTPCSCLVCVYTNSADLSFSSKIIIHAISPHCDYQSYDKNHEVCYARLCNPRYRRRGGENSGRFRRAFSNICLCCSILSAILFCSSSNAWFRDLITPSANSFAFLRTSRSYSFAQFSRCCKRLLRALVSFSAPSSTIRLLPNNICSYVDANRSNSSSFMVWISSS
jgi:hypothetical protein